jgi:hypothetical protein
MSLSRAYGHLSSENGSVLWQLPIDDCAKGVKLRLREISWRPDGESTTDLSNDYEIFHVC